MNLKDKKVLVTQPLMDRPMGSSMVTWELCEYMRSVGADVDLYVCIQASPMIDLPKSLGVNVICDEEAEIDLRSYDLVWVHSQVLPHKCISQLTDAKGLPRIAFNHMSSIIHDDLPWIPAFESRLSSLSICVSDLAADVVRPIVPNEVPLVVMNNPVPMRYCDATVPLRGSLHRLLIVTNHITKEVSEARRILESRGIEVSHAGSGGDFACPMSPELLAEYDAVLTIGKTIQYCLVMGIPSFVYDHFGGPGYLNDENYQAAKDVHFSGKDRMVRQDAGDLAERIISGYEQAFAWFQSNRETRIDEYAIDRILPAVLSQMSTRDVTPLDPYDAYAIEQAEGVIHSMFYGYTNRDQTVARLSADLRARRADIDELQSTIRDNNKVIARIDADLHARHADIEELQSTIRDNNEVIARIDADLHARHADIDKLQATIRDNNRVIADLDMQLAQARRAANPVGMTKRVLSFVRRRLLTKSI